MAVAGRREDDKIPIDTEPFTKKERTMYTASSHCFAHHVVVIVCSKCTGRRLQRLALRLPLHN